MCLASCAYIFVLNRFFSHINIRPPLKTAYFAQLQSVDLVNVEITLKITKQQGPLYYTSMLSPSIRAVGAHQPNLVSFSPASMPIRRRQR